MASIILTGDESLAGKYLSWAKNQLAIMKRRMKISGLRSNSKIYVLENEQVRISISSAFLQDRIMIAAEVGEFIIICFVGDTTGDFSSKRFYNDSGQEIARDEVGSPGSPPGWVLTDDGMYGPSPPADPDPWNITYAYNPGGLGIPHSGSGISPKKQAGKSVRYILDGPIEDETFEAFTWRVVWGGPVPAAYDYTYTFVRQVDSLTYAPYSIYGPRPFFARYVGGQVVTMIVPWAGYDVTFTWDAYQSANFRDKLPKMHKIWKVALADGARSFADVMDYGDIIPPGASTIPESDAVIGAAAIYDSETDTASVKLLRAKTTDWYADSMAEPIREEMYNLTTGTMTTGNIFHRCDDTLNELCYFYDADTDSGGPDVGSTIGNDVRIPHAIDENGKQTYVRIQKSGFFDAINTGLYCGDTLVEESGWENVIKPHDPERMGPLLIRNTRYRILHAHSDSVFKAVIYSKTKYVSHSDELLDYKVTIGGDYRQVRKTMIRSYTTYHISVNGLITDLGYSNYRREYRLTGVWDAYTGPAIPAVHGHIVVVPWVDCGYDAAGNLIAEDNSHVTRCDTNAAGGKLFVGFDVFPVKYRHELVYDVHENLTLDYKTSVFMFPPSSDAGYATVKDRKWMLFGTGGMKIKDIPPPQKPNNGGHVNRINGLAFMGA